MQILKKFPFRTILPPMLAVILLVVGSILNVTLPTEDDYTEVSSKTTATGQYWIENVSDPILVIMEDINQGKRPDNCNLSPTHEASMRASSTIQQAFNSFFRKPGEWDSLIGIWMANYYLDKASEEVINAQLLVQQLQRDCVFSQN